MSLTQSTMLDLGSNAPRFTLPSTEGKEVSLSDFSSSEALVVIFMCNHCPYVIHIADALAVLAKEYQLKGVSFVGINSNDIEAYPADNLQNMIKEKALRQYEFPYLLDETQEVAKAYGAACTPDLYVFDGARSLIYRGEFDTTRPHRVSSGNYDSRDGAASGSSLRAALDTLLAGKKVPEKQYPSVGCNIKWKPGKAPAYFG